MTTKKVTFKSECLKLLKRRTKNLVKLLNLNAPEIVIAQSILLVWNAGEGFCGKEIYSLLADRRIGELRQVMSYCQECDNPINVNLSQKPVCEGCDFKIDKEFNENC